MELRYDIIPKADWSLTIREWWHRGLSQLSCLIQKRIYYIAQSANINGYAM